MGINTLNTTASGTKIADEDWLAEDVAIKKDIADISILVSVDTAVLLEITLDGDNYETLNNGVAINPDRLYEFNIPDVFDTDTFNIRTPTVGGCTINTCRIVEKPVNIA